tara:strand:+ start:310 stop:1107 length:798 start_codon:yes stop_codon:yes gene_type:complete
MTVKNNALHTSEALVATRRSAGFTLVEVVVVIGIIGLLLSLTFPALGSIRLSALNAKDISQIRQLGLAHRMYQQVYSDAFVDVGLPHGGYGDRARSFSETLQAYTSTEIMKSPLDTSAYWDGGLQEEGSEEPIVRRTSYGMNNYLSRNYSPMVALEGPAGATDRMTRIKQPDKVVCFLHMTETGSYAVSDHPHVESWAFGPEPWTLASTQVSISAAEGEKNVYEMAESNYGMLDGSTVTRTFNRVYENAGFNSFDPNAGIPLSEF